MPNDVNRVKLAQTWLDALKLAKNSDEKWVKRGKKIIKRYRDDRTSDTGARRYNILWSNIQTILPALYGKTPKAQVERRFKDQDPIGRTASQIIERALQYELDKNQDFDYAVRSAILDRLLPGRGVNWVRFVPNEQSQTAEGLVQYECTPTDYVYWEDYRHSPARTWDEVTWVARRVYLTKQEVIARFGDEYSDVPLTHEPMGVDEMKKAGSDVEAMQKAQVWEIWDKSTKKVVWVAEGYQKALDYIDDPYGLDEFWPCPKPLFATQTTDTLVPVPDYTLYQDQAEEIDLLTQRIGLLVKALKVVGVYDATQTGVQRMLSEGVENTLIPVDSWAAFSEKGGIKGTVDFLPLDQVVNALQQCYAAREQAKQVIYEVTGLSDIIRGSSVASETATAQQIKSQYASLRLRDLQKHIAVFASEVLRIKAQLMCDLYAPDTLVQMSGIMGTQDAQFVPQAIELIKSEKARNYRIEIASDSLVEMDEATEKQSRMEFLQAVGGYLQQALPAAQQVPELTPLLAEMLLFGVRAFKGGRPMEAAFDTAMAQLSAPKPPKPTPPDPEQIKADAMLKAKQEELASNSQIEFQRISAQKENEQVKLRNDIEIEAMKMAHELDMEKVRQDAETRRNADKLLIEQETALKIAKINADAKEDASEVKETENGS